MNIKEYILNNTLLLNESLGIKEVLNIKKKVMDIIIKFINWIKDVFYKALDKFKNAYFNILFKVSKMTGSVKCNYNLNESLKVSMKSSNFIKESNNIINVLKDCNQEELINNAEIQLNEMCNLNDKYINNFLEKKEINYIKVEELKKIDILFNKIKLEIETSEQNAKKNLDYFKNTTSYLDIRKASLFQCIIKIATKHLELISKILIEIALSLSLSKIK